jgi:uncharacterized protein YndB with AHSA1/START domain
MAESNKIVVERVFDTPVESVWKAWTDPHEVSKWWGPRNFVSPDNKIDLRAGGKYVFAMQATGEMAEQFGDKPMHSGGVYKEIIERKKLVFTDNFTDADGNPVSPETYGMPADFPENLEITVELEELPGGKTKLTLTHRGLPAGEMADQTEGGWKESFDKLAESLA